jgi:3-oxoacyl-[acyl-carrier protein] reductase
VTERLVSEGAKVVVANRDTATAEALAERLNIDETVVLPVKTDVCSEQDVANLTETTIKKFGKIDILVNSAGGYLETTEVFLDLSIADWDKIVALNLRGTYLCTLAAVKHMVENHYGRIVNVSSLAGRSRSYFANAAYAASKAGVIGLTRHTSMELGRHGITINAVTPGFTVSDERIEKIWNAVSKEDKEAFLSTFPLGRPGTGEEQAAAIVFLCSDDASNINGAVLDVNGGAWVG